MILGITKRVKNLSICNFDTIIFSVDKKPSLQKSLRITPTNLGQASTLFLSRYFFRLNAQIGELRYPVQPFGQPLWMDTSPEERLNQLVLAWTSTLIVGQVCLLVMIFDWIAKVFMGCSHFLTTMEFFSYTEANISPCVMGECRNLLVRKTRRCARTLPFRKRRGHQVWWRRDEYV